MSRTPSLQVADGALQLLHGEIVRKYRLSSYGIPDLPPFISPVRSQKEKKKKNLQPPPPPTPTVDVAQAAESMYLTLENMGFEVGHRFISRWTRERPLFKDVLETIKFICRDFWPECFHSEVTSLKTNDSRGIFQVLDKQFKWLSNIRTPPPGEGPDIEKASDYLILPAGIIRGALYGLGIEAVVEPSLVGNADCKFEITVSNTTGLLWGKPQ
eukprot:NODE_1586_length_803_cov_109.516272_g1537_i0.p1 GENE.NODE_1586_length_803_cov_109.516272_g1537_i0~~NODE_1586_length_803_cov_109.516272_g1537_i0.p1  ORF type:complete len:213 (-),score=8.20 NODE_1586_length_803_cov_109.516272_g1537_i0:107-745(-)